MFENHVLQEFELPNGSKVLEQLYGFPLINNSHVLADGSAATGFDCGVPPEPSVCIMYLSMYSPTTPPSGTGGDLTANLGLWPTLGHLTYYSYLIKHCDVKSPDHSGGFDLYAGGFDQS